MKSREEGSGNPGVFSGSFKFREESGNPGVCEIQGGGEWALIFASMTLQTRCESYVTGPRPWQPARTWECDLDSPGVEGLWPARRWEMARIGVMDGDGEGLEIGGT